MSVETRFWNKVVISTGCWEWLGRHDRDGYSRFGSGLAHRFVLGLVGRSVPTGLTVDHLCRNRGCVNPDHLDVVSLQENIRRGEGIQAKNARKTHCVHGHPFTRENTYIRPNGDRKCRRCTVAASKRYRERQRVLA